MRAVEYTPRLDFASVAPFTKLAGMMRIIITLLAGFALTGCASKPSSSAEQKQKLPNILWISAEDISPDLGCYGDEYSVSPNIDHLASQGVKFTRAFATAPVC